MRTIIVATDLSEVANNATVYAVKAAQITKEKIILFHLFKVSPHVANSRIGTQGIDEMALRMKSKIEAYAAELEKEYFVSIEVVVRMGDLYETAEQLMVEYDSTMMVIGMPKKTFEQNLLGNTTTSAVYKLKFPVLTIPESATFNGINEILYACDLTRGVHHAILKKVKEYAKLFDAMVEVIYVGDNIKISVEEDVLKRELDGVKYTYKNVQSESVLKAIQDEAVAISADVIVMTPHKYSFWASLLHQSRTRAMLSNGKIPLLAIGY